MAASQAILLLQKQLRDLCKKPVDGFSAGLVDETDMFEWSVSIIGPPDTLYDGGFFNAIMSFPKNYPNSPPTVRFTSEMWHPNVYPDGKVCISILHPPGDDPNGYELATERWTPVHTVESIVLSIISMLSSPNDESPANVDAALKSNKELMATSQASLLLQKQLRDLCKNPVDGFSAGLVDETNVFEWSVTIIGPPDTLYYSWISFYEVYLKILVMADCEGGFFNAIMSFPQNYPISPPTVRFTSEVWHPNVYADGKVCISILHPPGDDPNGYELATERWSPVHTSCKEDMRSILEFVLDKDGYLRKRYRNGSSLHLRIIPIHSVVESIVLSIISMLSSPNDESPANVDAAGRVQEESKPMREEVARNDVTQRCTVELLDVLKKGTGGYKRVVAAFGEDILQANGEVDRPKLGQIVFSDPGKRQLLNRLLAPFISSGILREILKLWLKGCKVIVLDIPLLFEAKMDKWTKPIIVVWVDTETQLQRLMARDGINEEDARNRTNAQMALDLKRSKADIVIDNSGTLEDLKEQFQKILVQVTRPLTWTEFWLSRQGAFSALVSIIIGVVVGKNVVGKL
ncbi:hypothetical protein DKX38_016365 [Salix brachista]|uniref:E2 ubiquitin-conjugating enzyme n=4 Tax=Salix TaxID=40685 RepID=A0A5N5L894_9ROSI|nr:hypothetical protein DKX38_016365 [Salix brachista]